MAARMAAAPLDPQGAPDFGDVEATHRHHRLFHRRDDEIGLVVFPLERAGVAEIDQEAAMRTQEGVSCHMRFDLGDRPGTEIDLGAVIELSVVPFRLDCMDALGIDEIDGVVLLIGEPRMAGAVRLVFSRDGLDDVPVTRPALRPVSLA